MGDEATKLIGWGLPASELPPDPAGAGEPTPPPANWVVGRFRVERELGRGGMGVVLLAHDRDLNRPVAVKLLRDDHPEVLARFRLEAHALAGLSHPNAVRVYEFGEHAGRPFLALEYVAGHSLHDALRAGPLDPKRASGLLAQVAEAVQAAHELGIVHRDLKPANVLLDATDTPKLTDFGIARRLDDGAGLTETNVALGTPGYMAPEQVEGQPPDARTDVYGLGATLYECLTGRPPFVGPIAAVLVQVIADDPVPPRALNAGVPADLETVCLKCLHKDPARRYPTATELAADLHRVVRGEPVRARPTGRAEKVARWTRRNKLPAALAAAAALSLVGGAAAAGLQAVRATTARDAEANQRRVAEANAAEAAAVNAFLLDDLLRQASSAAQMDRRHVPDPNLTVRVALDRAADAAGERFRGQPAVEERVRAALGGAYVGVGEYGKAADQFRQVADSCRGRFGPDHPEVLTAEADLANAHLRAGRPADAVALLERVAQVRGQADGPAHPDTVRAAIALATAYKEAGRPAEALPALEDAVRQAGAAFGPDHAETVKATAHLASVYKMVGRPADAVPLFEACLGRFREWLGPDHVDTVYMSNNLAAALQAAGRGAEAVPLLENGLRRRRGLLGPDHPETLTVQSNLAATLSAEGRSAEALPLAEGAGRLGCERLGPAHPITLVAEATRAVVLVAVGRAAEAVPVLEEVVRASRGTNGPAHPDTLAQLVNLGVAYARCGRPAAAVLLFDEAVKLRRKTLGPTHPHVADGLFELGVTLNAADRPADARPVLAECHQARRAARGPADPATLLAAYHLAQADLRLGRAAEAAAGFEAVWRGLAARDPGDRLAGEAHGAYGLCLLTLSRFAEAEPLLLARYHQFAADGGATDRLNRGRRRLADMYRAWGKPDEAATWRVELAPRPRPAP